MPHSKGVTVQNLIKVLEDSKKEKVNYEYFIDMGGELYISDSATEENVYKGDIHSFIEEMMKYFKIKDGN